jgi:hypothetical protein
MAHHPATPADSRLSGGSGAARAAGRGLLRLARWLVVSNWRVLLYVVIIFLCVLLAPEKPLKFIYTEF